ncbi:sensor domain-containing protein, partial [Patescibacteria group bacterium]
GKGFWNWIKAYLKDSFTWKSLGYLFIKFPLGIISFTVLVTLLSVSISLIGTPVIYYLSDIGIIQGTFCFGPNNICFLNSYFAAIIIGIVGVFSLFVTMHALNGLAHISGLLAKSMLEKKK